MTKTKVRKGKPFFLESWVQSRAADSDEDISTKLKVETRTSVDSGNGQSVSSHPADVENARGSNRIIDQVLEKRSEEETRLILERFSL